jgi:hypothetical protein
LVEMQFSLAQPDDEIRPLIQRFEKLEDVLGGAGWTKPARVGDHRKELV